MNKNLVIGVDIGGTRTKSGLVNLNTGQVLHQMVQPTEKKNEAAFINQMKDVISQCKAIALLHDSEITGIGFGIPGFTSADGMVITTYGFVEFMQDYSLKNIIESNFDLPCFIDNDARIVSLGEALYGKGKGYNRVLVLTFGTGVGFGFVVNKQFMESTPLSHMGGHMTISGDGETCYCGKKGCLEALLSSTGILNIAKDNYWNGELLPEIIFEAALCNDAIAIKIVDKLISYLSIAIHNYINILAPDVIVFGGGIAKGFKPYLEKIKGVGYLLPYPAYTFQLHISELEEQAGMLGSAALIPTDSEQVTKA